MFKMNDTKIELINIDWLDDPDLWKTSVNEKGQTPTEIGKQNAKRDECVKCGAKTIMGFNEKFCPNGCGDAKKKEE